jgi:hypothetical protein
MGAGKGKSKRAQSTLPAALNSTTVSYNEDAWARFVHEIDWAGTHVYDYYLCQNDIWEHTSEEHEKVATELFADAVDVGALILPPGCTSKEFQFKIEAMGETYGPQKIALLFRNASGFAIEKRLPWDLFRRNMDGPRVNSFLEDLAHAVGEVLLVKSKNQIGLSY